MKGRAKGKEMEKEEEGGRKEKKGWGKDRGEGR